MRNSDKIRKYLRKKYGETAEIQGLLKVLSVASLRIKGLWPKLNVLDIGPSGSWKTFTSKETVNILSCKRHTLFLYGTFTIDGIVEYLRSDRCIIVDDFTKLMSSRRRITVRKFISVTTDLISLGEASILEKLYKKTFKGNFSCIINSTYETYKRYRLELVESTLKEKMFIIFSKPTDEEQRAFEKEYNERMKIRFGKKIKLQSVKDVELKFSDKYWSLVKKLWFFGRYPTHNRASDIIRASLKTLAFIDGKKKVHSYCFKVIDQAVLRSAEPSKKYKIVTLWLQGYTVREICEKLNQKFESYKTYVYNTIDEYKKKVMME